MRRTSGDDDVLMVSRAGQAVRFHESDVRSMGRDTTGVAGMNVSAADNYVLAMDVARDDQDLFVITDAGFGKRTGIEQFRKTKRGAMGVRAIKAAGHKGDLAGALVVREHEELVFISEGGMVVRQSVRGISRQGRDATGVRVVNIKDDDRVSRRRPGDGDLADERRRTGRASSSRATSRPSARATSQPEPERRVDSTRRHRVLTRLSG